MDGVCRPPLKLVRRDSEGDTFGDSIDELPLLDPAPDPSKSGFGPLELRRSPIERLLGPLPNPTPPYAAESGVNSLPLTEYEAWWCEW